MREGFKSAINELGQDPNFVLLTGDHGYGLFDDFRKAYPTQFINVGVAEANCVAVAAGLAKAGLRPLVYGLASFIPSRVFEFLKMQVGLDGLAVTVVGDGGGLVYSTLGHSHQAAEDLALASALPNFQVFSPSSDAEAHSILTSNKIPYGPKYVRLGKSDSTINLGFPGDLIEPYRVISGPLSRVGVLAHGSMTERVRRLVELKEIQSVDLWSFPTIWPLQPKWLEPLSGYSSVLVVEEHLRKGGLASELLLSSISKQVEIVSVGISREPHSNVGDWEWALENRGLGWDKLEIEIMASLEKLGLPK